LQPVKDSSTPWPRIYRKRTRVLYLCSSGDQLPVRTTGRVNALLEGMEVSAHHCPASSSRLG
jgi:hypothetical protein